MSENQTIFQVVANDDWHGMGAEFREERRRHPAVLQTHGHMQRLSVREVHKGMHIPNPPKDTIFPRPYVILIAIVIMSATDPCTAVVHSINTILWSMSSNPRLTPKCSQTSENSSSENLCLARAASSAVVIVPLCQVSTIFRMKASNRGVITETFAGTAVGFAEDVDEALPACDAAEDVDVVFLLDIV
jgi:hypothetical protein